MKLIFRVYTACMKIKNVLEIINSSIMYEHVDFNSRKQAFVKCLC